MNNSLVSVIVPVYKVEKYLDKCVESIVGQTYENLEIILVDDGSPDNCPAMCDEWAERDSRIKVIHKENGGVSSARNIALNVALGEYLCFVDSDDILEIDAVEYMLKNIGEADVIQCSFVSDYSDGSSIKTNVAECELEGEMVARAMIMDELRPEVCGKLYRTTLFSGIRFPTQGYGEDLYVNYIVMKKVNKLVSRNVGLYHYVHRESGSATSDYMTDARAELYRLTGAIVESEKGSSLYKCCVYRHTRILFATLSRIISGNKSFYDKYFDLIVHEILSYKWDILNNRHLGSKFKMSVIMLYISPKLYAKVYGIVLKRKGR